MVRYLFATLARFVAMFFAVIAFEIHSTQSIKYQHVDFVVMLVLLFLVASFWTCAIRIERPL